MYCTARRCESNPYPSHWYGVGCCEIREAKAGNCLIHFPGLVHGLVKKRSSCMFMYSIVRANLRPRLILSICLRAVWLSRVRSANCINWRHATEHSSWAAVLVSARIHMYICIIMQTLDIPFHAMFETYAIMLGHVAGSSFFIEALLVVQ